MSTTKSIEATPMTDAFVARWAGQDPVRTLAALTDQSRWQERENNKLKEVLQRILDHCQPPALANEGTARAPKDSMLIDARAVLRLDE